MTRSPRSPGFTLLELIVAMAMVAILAGSLYACIYIGFRSRETGRAAVEPAQKIANVFTMLSQDLEGTMPPTGIYAAEFQGFNGSSSSDSGNQSGASSTGNNSTAAKSQGLTAASLNSASSSNLHVASNDPGATTLLSFYTNSNVPRDDEFGSDMRKIELSLETPEHATRSALVRRVYTNLGPSKEPAARNQVLCRNVRSAYLRFYDGSLWLDTWDSKGQGDLLPLAVELTIEMDLPDAKLQSSEWPLYKMTRVFKVPCGAIADTTSSASTGTTGTTGGAGGGGGR